MQKKAAEKARIALKRKADKELKLPSMQDKTSQLQVALDAAREKREHAKKAAKIETNKVKAARRRVDRMKERAKNLLVKQRHLRSPSHAHEGRRKAKGAGRDKVGYRRELVLGAGNLRRQRDGSRPSRTSTTSVTG